MIKRLMNYLQGVVTLCATVPFPERLVNLCAQDNIEFWAVEQLDGQTLRLTVRRRALAKVRRLVEKLGGEARLEESRGLPDFLGRFRTRYTFLIGLVFAACAVGILSRFVFTIEVTGNDQIPTAVILNQLRQLGVRPGVYGPALERGQLAQELLNQQKKLSYAAVNLHGTRLEIIIREAVEPPERVDTSEYIDLVAETDGIVVKVEAELGDSLVSTGDTVAAGDTLISGTVTMEPPLYSGMAARYYQTHARGRVWARTWRTLSASIPLECEGKEYTGREKRVWSASLFGKRTEFFGSTSISWPKYDKITTVHRGRLPLALTEETFREYEPVALQIDQKAAQAMLEQRLLAMLEGLLGQDGSVSSTRYESRVEDGQLTVTMTAECMEEITAEQAGKPPQQSGTETAP